MTSGIRNAVSNASPFSKSRISHRTPAIRLLVFFQKMRIREENDGQGCVVFFSFPFFSCLLKKTFEVSFGASQLVPSRRSTNKLAELELLSAFESLGACS